MNQCSAIEHQPMDWVGDWAGRRAAQTPMRSALIDTATQQTLSYVELDRRARQWAAWLGDVSQCQAGDVVALIADNQAEAIALYFGCTKLGVILAPISHRLSPHEASALIARVNPRCLLVAQALIDFADQLSEPANSVPREPLDGGQGALTHPSIADDPAITASPRALTDLCLLVHTGGSTGLPKICRISHRQMLWNAIELLLADMDGLAQRREWLTFPLFHIGGWNTVLPILYAGGCVVIAPRFEPQATLAGIARYQINHLGVVEAMLNALSAAPGFAQADLSSLTRITSAGAACSIRSMEPFLTRGIAVNQAYGLTEAGPSNLGVHPDNAVGVGQGFFHSDIRIVDPASAQPVAVGEVGELELRSLHAFDGYWDDPERTAALWRNEGWLRSGDWAYRDANGNVHIVGRLDQAISSGGERIAPEEIEAVLCEHPRVQAALVFGVTAMRWGERPVAWVVGPSVDDVPAIKQWLQPRLARFKQPDRIDCVDALPLTGAGKPDRQAAKRSVEQTNLGEGL